MTQVSSIPTVTFFSQANQAKKEDGGEEYGMASHSVEDPVRLGPQPSPNFYSYRTAC